MDGKQTGVSGLIARDGSGGPSGVLGGHFYFRDFSRFIKKDGLNAYPAAVFTMEP
jgi:hypothetical protein